MLNQPFKAYRVLATGLSFLVFGVGAVSFGALILPFLTLFVRQDRVRNEFALRCIRGSFRGFIYMMRAIGVLTYELRHFDRLNREGLLIVANHPSLIDVIFLMGFTPRSNCVVKAELAVNPFLKAAVRGAGFIRNFGGESFLADCNLALSRGGSLVIFPEGTRTPRVGRKSLHRGAANLAVRTKTNVTPVRISVDPLTLGKGEPWWRVPDSRPHFLLVVGEDLSIEPYIGFAEPIAARQLNADFANCLFMENCFE